MNKKYLLKLAASVLFLLTVVLSGCAETMMTEEDGSKMTEKSAMDRSMVMKDSLEPMTEESMTSDENGMKEEAMGESKVDMAK